MKKRFHSVSLRVRRFRECKAKNAGFHCRRGFSSISHPRPDEFFRFLRKQNGSPARCATGGVLAQSSHIFIRCVCARVQNYVCMCWFQNEMYNTRDGADGEHAEKFIDNVNTGRSSIFSRTSFVFPFNPRPSDASNSFYVSSGPPRDEKKTTHHAVRFPDFPPRVSSSDAYKRPARDVWLGTPPA